MRIAYITHEYPPDTGKGGIGTYTFQMAKIMHDLGHKVEVFTASFDRSISETYNSVLTHRIQINSIADFKIQLVDIFAKQHKIKKTDEKTHGFNIPVAETRDYLPGSATTLLPETVGQIGRFSISRNPYTGR